MQLCTIQHKTCRKWRLCCLHCHETLGACPAPFVGRVVKYGNVEYTVMQLTNPTALRRIFYHMFCLIVDSVYAIGADRS